MRFVPLSQLEIPYELHKILVYCGRVVHSPQVLRRISGNLRLLTNSMLTHNHVAQSSELNWPRALEDAKVWQDLVEDLNTRKNVRTLLGDIKTALHFAFSNTELKEVDKQIAAVRVTLPVDHRGDRARLSIPIAQMPPQYVALLQPFACPHNASSKMLGIYDALQKDLGRMLGALDRNGITWRDMRPTNLGLPQYLDILADDLHNPEKPEATAPRFQAHCTSLRRLGVIPPLPKDWRRKTPTSEEQDRPLSEKERLENYKHRFLESRGLHYADQKLRELRSPFLPDEDSNVQVELDGTDIDRALFEDLVTFDKRLELHPVKARQQNLNVTLRDATVTGLRYALVDWHLILQSEAPALNKAALAGQDFLDAMEVFRKSALSHSDNTMTVAGQMYRIVQALRLVRGHAPEDQLIVYRAGKLRKSSKSDITVPNITQSFLHQIGQQICETVRQRINDLRDVASPYMDLTSLARQYRNGLIIALLSFLPLRLSSLKMLELGESVRQTETGYAISLKPNQLKPGSKTGESLYQTLPAWLSELFAHYIEAPDSGPSIRQLIAPESTSRAMWLSSQGSAASIWVFKYFIPQITVQIDGTYATTHDFRRIIATHFFATDPELAKIFLGHRKRRMTEGYVEKDQQQNMPRKSCSTLHAAAESILSICV